MSKRTAASGFPSSARRTRSLDDAPGILLRVAQGSLRHGDMVILSCVDVTVVGVVSVTLTVKVKTPVAVGLPEITPVPAFKTNPVGSGPVTRAQV